MTLPPKLTKFSTTSPVIASFSFTELLSSQGFLKLFLLDTADSGGINTVLTENSATYGATGLFRTTDATEFDLDSSKLQSGRTMEGKATINLFGKMNSGTSGTSKYLIKIRKFDGSTESDIANVTTDNRAVGSGVQNIIFSVQVDIPKTRFRKGEQIRISITHTQTFVGGGTNDLHVDPVDRSGTPANSNVNLPFNIDI